LQPALALAPVPDAVFGAEHPPPALAVQDCEVANGDPEGSRLKAPHTAFLDQVPVTQLGFRERVDSHPQSMYRDGLPALERCRIRYGPRPLNASHHNT